MLLKILFSIILILSSSTYAQQQTSLECIDRSFSLIVHVVNDSNHKPAAYSGDIISVVKELNEIWKPICVEFTICEIRQDSNYNFNIWNQDTMEREYLALHYKPRHINIIVVDSIELPKGIGGYASGTISTRGTPSIVVMGASVELWAHEMGHYFGLAHTFKSPIALADNSNCSLDDGVCDTPPDPDPTGNLHNQCVYIGNAKDATGKYYNPLIENFMSYYKGCRKSFTHMQYEKMVTTYKIDKEAHF